MLVLSRKKNETIKIGDDIEIVIVEIRGDKVRLGIQAPKEVPVHRSEVYAAIHAGTPVHAPVASDEDTVELDKQELIPEPAKPKRKTKLTQGPLARRASEKPEVA